MKRVTIFCRSIAIFCWKKEQHKRHSRKKAKKKQKTKQTESQIKRNERRNEREQDIYTKGRDFEWRNTRPTGLELARRITEFCSGATRIRANFGRERNQCGFFERFRQGLEREGAGAVREAEQEERKRRGGRGWSRRRRVTTVTSVFHHRTNCGRYRPLLRSGSGSVFARGKIYTIGIMQSCTR